MIKKMFHYLSILQLIVILSAISSNGFAQYAHFVENGKIEYEKKVNMYAKIQNRITPDNSLMQKIYEEYKRNQPQFNSSKYTLSFSTEKSVYQFIEEATQATSFFGSEPWLVVKNSVYTDFTKDSITILKKVFEEDYVVKDKKADILWKITNEVRDIAGYPCRRANGLILDSIYVVAFYTDEIIPAGGPESFSGLPGMILGVALPHENVTWFATKVDVTKQSPSPVQLPKKASIVTREDLKAVLQKVMKNWGDRGDEALKAFML